MAVAMASDYTGVSPTGRVRQGWRRREGEIAARLAVLRDAVFDAVGAAAPLPRVEWDGPWRSAEVVSNLIHFCIARLRNVRSSDTASAERLCALILELQQLALDLYLHDTGERSQRLAECAAGLSRLRSLRDTTALLDVACEEIVLRCGFQRVVLSRVEGRSWRPSMAHFAAERESESWFADWINESIPLDSRSPEAQLLAKRRPSLVYDTSNAPVYRPIIVDAGRSRSYVVAPIVHGDDVVGFVHADHHPLTRRADEGDRDVLWAFTDGFSHIYERTVLLEQLREQRDQVRDLIVSAVNRMDDLCEADISIVGAGDFEDRESALIVSGAAYGNMGDLTEREADVFRLMVAGATNRAIAERLIISEGTVKSHVKHILRKFGAANRAQAIAWSLQAE
ncbi:LuxR C-terminal-related transcriptional regulator [Nocardia nova]|uniref:Transcriptional regulatory protein DegU n=1 Tax=Nocardia cerradoensis TaxID=85688 RepID=A0A231GTQ7_9NOCA|nr:MULTISPECIES: LuxR C-terminal-related transcriptional regulator [Nocardia]OXR39972.1 Transcriptional regulatory protein DegU [Nocardia cerradoensis]PPJ12066.1 LuxR family transcriptional regulator [Nocardia nova]PPJ14795.1 LuxR family transcriptional regulator [Nocardia nova]